MKYVLIAVGVLLALWIAFYLVSWIFLILTSITIPMKKVYDKPSKFYYKIFNYGYWIICKHGRVKIHTSGTEKIPTDGIRFLFVSNHRSKFDNMIHSLTMKNQFLAFISKTANFKIPMGRHFMQRSCYIATEQNNVKSGLNAVLRAISLIKSDATSIAVFPEGTRSKDNTLLEFKPGCFKIAEKTKCPIVVGVTQGTERIHKNWPWKKTDTYFDVIDVIYPEQLEGKTTVEISDYVYKEMKEYLMNNPK